MLTPEQVAETRKANLGLFFELSNKAVDNVGKLAALNAHTMRSTLEDMFGLAQKSLSIKEAQEWLALQDSMASLTAERMQTYWREVFDLMSATQADFARVGKAQCERYGRQMKSVVEDVTRGAPAGSQATMTALDSAIAAATTLYETLRSTGQQAVEATRSNLEIASAAAKNARRAVDPALQAAKR